LTGHEIQNPGTLRKVVSVAGATTVPIDARFLSEAPTAMQPGEGPELAAGASNKRSGVIEELPETQSRLDSHVTSSGTQIGAGQGDNLRSQQYSKRQAMRYEKKRHVGSEDKITGA